MWCAARFRIGRQKYVPAARLRDTMVNICVNPRYFYLARPMECSIMNTEHFVLFLFYVCEDWRQMTKVDVDNSKFHGGWVHNFQVTTKYRGLIPKWDLFGSSSRNANLGLSVHFASSVKKNFVGIQGPDTFSKAKEIADSGAAERCCVRS